MTIVSINGIELELPPHADRPGVMKRLNNGSYENSEAKAVLARLQPGFRVLELGAGLGYVSSLCAGVAGAENVVSVEANPKMVPVVRANLDRNGHQATTVLHGAVVAGSEDRTIRFQANKAFLGGSIAREGVDENEVVEVPALGIRKLLREHKPNMVVMDIEGAEAYLFHAPWNAQLRFLILELHPPRYSTKAIKRIVDCMSETGLTYDPVTSSGRILGFRRVWGDD